MTFQVLFWSSFRYLIFWTLRLFFVLALLFYGCMNEGVNMEGGAPEAPQKGRIWYQVFVRSFADSDGDGIGDLEGLTNRLDYLENLGVEGIWLLPIHPSSSYHKYDVSNYRTVDPVYGDMEVFERLLQEAHTRGMEVLLDMVFNHTDDEHEWFQEALKDSSSLYRDYYVWADSGKIQQNPHHWHRQPADGSQLNNSGEDFFGFFWKGMPDLNYDNAQVREEVVEVSRFWLDTIGVDGFRLDAALFIYPYYVNERDRTLAQTVDWWRYYRSAVDEFAEDVFLVAEVWEGDSVIAPFLQDALDACFNFSLAEEIIHTLQGKSDPSLLVPRLVERYNIYGGASNEFEDAIFLSNHDQNRVASMLAGNEEQLRLAASILFTLPGAPFIYYGEEIGMKGVKPDEAIREPMIWDAPGLAVDQPLWQPLKHNIPDSTRSVAEQRADTSSLWHHYETLIRVRKESLALHSGIIQPWTPTGDIVVNNLLAYTRGEGLNSVLVLHNLGNEQLEIPRPEEYTGSLLPVSETFFEKQTIVLPPQSSLILKKYD